MRASAGGLLRTFKAAGEYVETGDLLGRISDPFGEVRMDVLGETDGIVVGRANLPVVHEGDALFHIAETTSADVEMRVDLIANQLDGDPMFDEDEII